MTDRKFITYLVIFVVAFFGFILYKTFQIDDENYKNTLADLEMVVIPAGEMNLEVPIYSFIKTDYVNKHIVIKDEFQIGAYEITIKQWNICHQQGGCDKKARMRKGENENHPVTKVNWNDAYQFTQWLSAKTQQNFRLPTEEEWTYAAFMGEGYKAQYVEYDYNEVTLSRPKISRIKGTFGQNKWGMHDIQGNVWEWTLSCWKSSVDSQAQIGNADELNRPNACGVRFLWGEERAHIPFFINTTYNGGCATARPASNLGFRILLAKN